MKPLFKNKPLVIVLSKTYVRAYKYLDNSDRELFESLAQEHNTYLIQTSNQSGDGVADV